MTRRDTLQCIHEPFGDAFYYGPERLSARYDNDEQARIDSGFSQSTFKTIFDRIERESLEVGSSCDLRLFPSLCHFSPPDCETFRGFSSAFFEVSTHMKNLTIVRIPKPNYL